MTGIENGTYQLIDSKGMDLNDPWRHDQLFYALGVLGQLEPLAKFGLACGTSTDEYAYRLASIYFHWP